MSAIHIFPVLAVAHQHGHKTREASYLDISITYHLLLKDLARIMKFSTNSVSRMI